MISTSAYQIAARFIGIREVTGAAANPQILAMLRLDNSWPAGDDVAWCSAFVNYIAWILGLQRSRSLAARSWLKVGAPIELEQAAADSDIVIVKRGGGPGPDVLQAPGHVGFYAGLQEDKVLILGGNQGNSVSIAAFPRDQILGVRRLAA